MFSFHVVSPPQHCVHLSSPQLQALSPIHLILDLITWTCGEEFTSQCSSLRSFKYVQSSPNFCHVHYLTWSFQLVLGLPHNYSNSPFFFIFKGIILWGYNTSSFPCMSSLSNPETSILEGLYSCRDVKVFAYLLFLKAFACINGTKMWKKISIF